MKKKIIFSIVGARPHFVKAAPFLDAMKDSFYEVFTIHTGQHYDQNMSDIFFNELNLPKPKINLGVGSGTHAFQTAKVMQGIEELILEHKPEAVVVYGDTNTTLGSALASSKLYIPTIHIESGVRCFNRRNPEEINRIIIDHISDYLVCPSNLAVENLKSEGLINGVQFWGDFMYDSFLKAQKASLNCKFDLSRYDVESNNFILSTIHREKTTSSAEKLHQILNTFSKCELPIILPIHPRTKNVLQKKGYNTQSYGNLKIINPASYLEMMNLLRNCKLVITDSGGLEKESYWQGKPCITLMDETTWTETIDVGWNTLVGIDIQRIKNKVSEFINKDINDFGPRPEIYGPPGAANRFVRDIGWV